MIDGMTIAKRTKKSIWLRIYEARYLYLLLLPLVAFLVVFKYMPMVGLQIAFKKYSAKLGIWGSKWIGMDNFKRIFISRDAIQAIKNTFIISFERLIFEFPVPIILAMLINEMPGRKIKRIYQTILTFPHFLSWVIV
ncbi:MAG: sugar ABC transporter permease, partial [Clostridia bacterium]|nr:sugar ABC transporter permease [Clostridia bacterium]